MSSKEYYEKNKEKIKAKNLAYSRKNAERGLERAKKWYADNKDLPEFKEKSKIRTRNRYILNRDKILARSKERWYEQRVALLEQVGGAICKNCGFTDMRALQVDHVNGGGRAEVRDTKFRSPQRYAAHIALNPHNYQVLCANCNWIKRWENDEYKKR